jgi:hypothetical protein
MPSAGRASGAEAAARRAAEALVAAAAAEPSPGGTAAAGDTTSARATAATPRRRATKAALAALLESLLDASLDASPAGAVAALGVDGLFAALLREAAAPPGPHAAQATKCLVAIGMAASTRYGPACPDQRAAAAALLAAQRRDAACLFDAMGRVGAMQAAARSAGGAAPAGATPPQPAGAGVAAPATAPGSQLFVLLGLAHGLLLECGGPGDGALFKAFARSGAAVAATLEVLLHGCPGFDGEGLAREQAASVLHLVCDDPTGVRHLRGAFERVVSAAVQRLGRGAPGSTLDERVPLAGVLEVRWGRNRQAEGRRACAPRLGCTARLGPCRALLSASWKRALTALLSNPGPLLSPQRPPHRSLSPVPRPVRLPLRGGVARPVRRRLVAPARARLRSHGRICASGRGRCRRRQPCADHVPAQCDHHANAVLPDPPRPPPAGR